MHEHQLELCKHCIKSGFFFGKDLQPRSQADHQVC